MGGISFIQMNHYNISFCDNLQRIGDECCNNESGAREIEVCLCERVHTNSSSFLLLSEFPNLRWCTCLKIKFYAATESFGQLYK